MNHTTNYQLNQWELHDRVMMQDFNADNAKIDAALKAEADARAAETAARKAADAAINTELAKKSAFVKLQEQAVSSARDSVNIYFSGVDWSKWQRVHIDICANKLTTINVKLNGTTGNATFLARNSLNNLSNMLAQINTSQEAGVFAERITLQPGCQPNRLICVSFAGGAGIATITYAQLSYIQLSGGFAAGGKVIIWGEA